MDLMRATERLYLQYKPDEAGINYILELQARALKFNTQARPVDVAKLHLTLIHFGILTEVFTELKLVRPELTWDKYEKSVRKFIRDTQHLLPNYTEAKSLHLGLYGSRDSVLALMLEPSIELLKAHKHSLQTLIIFLEECGIEYPMAFVKGSRNFAFARDFNPHITLLRAARWRPKIDIKSTSLKLELLELRYK